MPYFIDKKGDLFFLESEKDIPSNLELSPATSDHMKTRETKILMRQLQEKEKTQRLSNIQNKGK
jgi:hypothetical protein